MTETFRTHPVYAHLDVSDLGRVLNTKTGNYVGAPVLGGGKGRRANAQPYMKVTVPSDETASGLSSRRVHLLVMDTFVGPTPAGHEVDHINHDRQDNRLDNLRYRPIPDNRADRWF